MEGGFNICLVAGYIPFEIALSISYFLMLQIHAIGCFLKDMRCFSN